MTTTKERKMKMKMKKKKKGRWTFFEEKKENGIEGGRLCVEEA